MNQFEELRTAREITLSGTTPRTDFHCAARECRIQAGTQLKAHSHDEGPQTIIGPTMAVIPTVA